MTIDRRNIRPYVSVCVNNGKTELIHFPLSALFIYPDAEGFIIHLNTHIINYRLTNMRTDIGRINHISEQKYSNRIKT